MHFMMRFYSFTWFLMIRFCCGQHYSETCPNSYYQDQGVIHLPPPQLFRAPPALRCKWTFTAKEGDSLLITFHEFSIGVSRGCTRGYIKILDGLSNTSESILHKSCHPIQTPAQFKSSSNSVSILFYSKYFRGHDRLVALVKTVSPKTFYRFHLDKKNWLDARDFCRKDHGDLANVYPVPSQKLADIVENNHSIRNAWVGQFVAPWVSLKGCIKWSSRHGIEPRYFRSKYNQKTECSVACLGSSVFLLQGGSCYCLNENHRYYLNDSLLASDCSIPCPGNELEKCGGKMAFTYYKYIDLKIKDQAKFKDCVSETIDSFHASDCDTKYGFSCKFQNGSIWTYFFDDNLPWNDARIFCEGLSGALGLSYLPHWPSNHVKALWTSVSRGQHWNYPQVLNKSSEPDEAYLASVNDYGEYELKLQRSDQKYAFICEYQVSTCGGNFTTTMGNIQSPNFPHQYRHNEFCQWIITVPEPDHIRLEFSDFQLEEHELCLYDFVEIKTSGNRFKDVRFCGNFIPRVFLSEGQMFTITFKSDNTVSATGFRAHWRTVDPSYRELESNASRRELGGGAMAGIVLGTIMVVLFLFLIVFLLYWKRHKKHSSSSSTVSNQIYGISSFSDESVTDVGHNYANLQRQRNSGVVEQCYTNQVRDELQDLDDRGVFDYEQVCENRLELDAGEYLENTGSQANLIASDGEDITEVELYRIPEKHKDYDLKEDSITVESMLSLDDIENMGNNAITLVECQTAKDNTFDDTQTYSGAKFNKRDTVPLEFHGGGPSTHSQDAEHENMQANLLEYEIPQGISSSYIHLDSDVLHAPLTTAPSHNYEEIQIDNTCTKDPKIPPLLTSAAVSGHAPVSQASSDAYAEIKAVDP